MVEKLVRAESPVEFFRELVERAIERQRLDSTELSSFYLVHLLDAFVRLDRVYAEVGIDEDVTLAELLCRAISATGSRRLALFKTTGDVSLFVSGFFPDSLTRSLVDADYYVKMGEYAYGRASRLSRQDAAAAVFAELSRKFVRFVDILNEVSEQSALSTNQSLLRLYEKWLRTGSPRSASLLREEGVLLPPGANEVH